MADHEQRERPVVPVEVLAGAWATVQLLDADPDDATAATEALQARVGQLDPTDLVCGHFMLAGVLAQRLAEFTTRVPADDPSHVEPLDLVAPILERIRHQFPEVPARTLPNLAAVLVAGLLGEPVLAWATDHLPVPDPNDRLGMVYLVWCLANFTDSLGNPGDTDRALNLVFARSTGSAST